MKWLGALFVAGAFACGPTPGQPPECAKYIECLNAVDPGMGDSIDPSYGKLGTCWRSGEAAAGTCHKVCIDNLASEAEKMDAPAECL